MSITTDKINDLCKDSLERLKKESLLPVPENYELWYRFYAGSHPEVVREINQLEKDGVKITSDHCHDIYQRCLSEEHQSDEVRKAGSQIQETIRGVTSLVTNVKTATSEYSQSLSEVTQELNNDNISQEKLKTVLTKINNNTQDMMSQNLALEEELSKSSQVMEELQRNLEIARQEALTDGLTNLANRKAFDAEIERIAKESIEEQQSFSLIMMDIDHFKSFNDNYGHQVGDQVLRLVSKTLKDGVKGRDVAARYGGEEFAIILPETPLEFALKVADTLRQAVANKEIVNRNSGETMGRITLSGGASQYIHGEDTSDLIERADAALYTAKHNGRNQIAAAPLPETTQ